MWSLSSTTFLLHLLSVFFYFFNFLLSWTRHGNVGHMTWYRVRNIPAQLCYAPDDSQLFRALVSMHSLSQYTRVSQPHLSYSSMFSFIWKLSFSTSWNSTLKRFKNEVIHYVYSCSWWCFFLFLFSLSLFMVDFFLVLNPLFFFLTASFN